MRHLTRNHSGFTLVELTVVVMILGILAAIVAPRVLNTSQTAIDNSIRHSLSVIRSAIDMYAAEHGGTLPGSGGTEASFLSDIRPYIRGGTMPMCSITAAGNNNDVYILLPTDDPGYNGGVGTHAWAYNPTTGGFYVNCPDLSSDAATTYDQF